MLIRCGACRATVDTAGTPSGQSVLCPGCGGSLVVPTPFWETLLGPPHAPAARTPPRATDDPPQVEAATGRATSRALTKACPECGERFPIDAPVCPSCGARYGAALRAMRRAESDYEDAALERTWLSFLLVTSVAIIVGGVAWFVVSLVPGEDVLSPILVASGGPVGYLKGQLAWLKLPPAGRRPPTRRR